MAVANRQQTGYSLFIWFYYRTNIHPVVFATSGATMTLHRYLTIDSTRIFYREAGRPEAPVLLLLHGFPASSFMFRDLMARLSERFHVIAPDYPGFGYSDAPQDGVAYTFDYLAEIMGIFVEQLGLKKYAIYMQDFGGPVGFRLA